MKTHSAVFAVILMGLAGGVAAKDFDPAVCAGCHKKGNSAAPELMGLTEAQILEKLNGFKSGKLPGVK